MDREKYLPLAPRDLLVLSVLAEGPLHGYGIIKAVEGRSESGVFLDPANLYRVLRRMRRVGWIRETSTLGRRGEDVSAEPRDPRDLGWKGTGGRIGETAEGSPGATLEGSGNSETRRKTYKITSDGRAILAAELTRLERLLLYARPALAGAPNSSHPGKEG